MRVNPNISNDILTNLWNIQAQEQQALQEVSTGKRVNMPSDDPSAAAAEVQNRADQSRTDQYLQSTSTLEGMLQTADSTLSSVVTELTKAISLGVQGANGGLSPTDQQSIAQEVQGIRDGMVQLANTSYQGVYIFGGTTKATPYVLNPAQASGVQYNGNSGINSVQIADGRSVQINVPGNQLFQATGADIFASLQQLISALRGGNTTTIGNATTQIRTALDSVSAQRVFYGNTINELTSNQTYLRQEKISLQSQENDLVSIDPAKAATDLNNAQTAHSAALAALARVLPQSLLDYLK